MKTISTLCVVVVLTGLLGSGVNAQGTNAWAGGYPKTGTANGTILVKGTATPDAGWSLTGGGTVVYWPVGGGAAQSVPVDVNRTTGNWGEAPIGALTSGTEYWVVHQAIAKMGAATAVLATDPKKATAK